MSTNSVQRMGEFAESAARELSRSSTDDNDALEYLGVFGALEAAEKESAGRPQFAIELFERCRQDYCDVADGVFAAFAAHSQASLLNELGSSDEALSLAKSSLSRFTEDTCPLRVAETLMRIGIAYERLDRVSEAIETFESALAKTRETGDISIVSTGKLKLADALLASGRIEDSELLLRSVANAENLQVPVDLRVQAFQIIAQCRSLLGDDGGRTEALSMGVKLLAKVRDLDTATQMKLARAAEQLSRLRSSVVGTSNRRIN